MNLFVVGGFLGSGKTTAIQKASLLELANRKRVAVITNDQGVDLVDTGFMASSGLHVLEVTAGCFCCNYTQFTEVMDKLTATHAPDIIFAESVGSCTDLVATVANPLAKFHPGISVIISVFVDVQLLHALVSGHASFIDDNVRYIYKKQLAEADLIVLNKIDLINAPELEEIKQYVMREYRTKGLVLQNSYNEGDVNAWLSMLTGTDGQRAKKSLDINYDTYARGEAILGWVDQRMEIKSAEGKASHIAIRLIYLIHRKIKRTGYPVAHLKFLLDANGKRQKFSFTMMDKITEIPKLELAESEITCLLLNARVQINAADLGKLIDDAIAEVNVTSMASISVSHKAAFQPGYPKPRYRMAE